MRLPILVVAVALGLLVGCGGGGGGQKAGTSISMQGLRFHPATATVRVGKPVVWTNDDSVDHNVTATSGASFRTRAFGHGNTFRYVPTKPGTIRYVCTLHPGMEGVLTITR
jgi:plastocyanin